MIRISISCDYHSDVLQMENVCRRIGVTPNALDYRSSSEDDDRINDCRTLTFDVRNVPHLLDLFNNVQS